MPSNVPTIQELREKAAARIAEARKGKAANLPSKAVDSVLSKQMENLRRTIDECARLEERRAMKMERAPTKDAREKLDTRFEMEREADRRRISVIKDDLTRLKTETQHGAVSNKDLTLRFHQALHEARLPKALEMGHNRFQGLETPVDFILHRANVGMFDKHDEDFRRRVEASKPKFDVVHETKKFHLLEEKRDILRQVVAVQQREIQEMERRQRAATLSVPTGRAIVNNIKHATQTFMHELDTKQRKLEEWKQSKSGGGGGRPSSSASSVSSRASTASMATFASPSRQDHNRSKASRVPRLSIPR
jgi:hypothetical protein